MDALQIKALQEMSRSTRSLDEPLFGEAEETSLAEVLPDTQSATVEEQVSQMLLYEARGTVLEQVLNEFLRENPSTKGGVKNTYALCIRSFTPLPSKGHDTERLCI